jgi:hypothetical protein
MKLRNILLGVVLVIIIAIAGILFFVFNSLDSLVESAIEEFGSDATQTAVRVDKVNITLQEGGGTITSLTVANPEGFSDLYAFSLGEINMRIDVNSLTKDVLVIEEIQVHAPQIFYEINAQGKANLNILKENLAGDKDKEQQQQVKNKAIEAEAEKQTRVIIKRFTVDSGSIQTTIVPMENEVKTVSLSRLELKNIGGNAGSSSRDISRQLLKHVIDHVLMAVAQEGIEKYLGDSEIKGLATGVLDNLNKQLKTGDSNLGDNIKGLFGD